MLKLTVAVLAVALAGTASAGWRSMRLEANDEASFTKSLAVFKAKLSPARRVVFGEALKDIWVKGTLAAEAVQREYTASDYYRQIDGLRYDEIVRLVDPTGDTAKARYRAAAVSTRAATPDWAEAKRGHAAFVEFSRAGVNGANGYPVGGRGGTGGTGY
jgi:hypothetical protein